MHTERTTWHYLKHDLRRLGTRLSQWQHAVALFVLLLLGLIEPLACILHCELWLPLTPGIAATTASHHHREGHQQHQLAATTDGAMPVVRSTTTAAPGTHCLVRWLPLPGSDMPTAGAPAPFHEMLPLAGTSLLLVLLLRRWPGTLFLRPPPAFIAAPLRPPIACA